MTVSSRVRHPRTAAPASYTPVQVANAYNYPRQFTGAGYVCGIIELGGGFGQADLVDYFGRLGLPVPHVVSVPVAGGVNKSDGANGADGEVLLDIEVAASIAPGAEFRVYFTPNTDDGFLAGIKQAVTECDTVTISWGQAESQWAAASMDAFDAVFLEARKAGVIVFAAAGDSGSTDSTSANVVDFPASSPNVIGCGGTRLVVDSSGARVSEVAWNDSPTTSASGGGVSRHFPGRQVPDVAGNADPDTGYQVEVDGSEYVIGGTSAVAPLHAGLVLLLCQAVGGRLGHRVDFLNLLATNQGVFFDVTSGNNGGYKAGPGRDDVTGWGVIDGGKLLAVLGNGIPAPVPIGTPPPPPPPVVAPPVSADAALLAAAPAWLKANHHATATVELRAALAAWVAAHA